MEINPAAEAPFLKSRQRLIASNSAAAAASLPSLSYCVAAAGSDPEGFLAAADVVIVDPPRKGLELDLLQALLDLPSGSMSGSADVVFNDPPRKGLEPELLQALLDLPSGSISGSAAVVIVDPPRRALEPEQLMTTSAERPGVGGQPHARAGASSSQEPGAGSIRAASYPQPSTSGPHTFIYLSCGWEALKVEFDRITGGDASHIRSEGGGEQGYATIGAGEGAGQQVAAAPCGLGTSGPRQWRLRHAEAFLFFPGTDSIETLCVFERDV